MFYKNVTDFYNYLKKYRLVNKKDIKLLEIALKKIDEEKKVINSWKNIKENICNNENKI